MGEDIKRMADLLRSGATMLSEACPQCHSPLFKLSSGEIFCAKCNRKVIIVKEGEEEAVKVFKPTSLPDLMDTLMRKIQQIEAEIKTEKTPEKLQLLLIVLNLNLDALAKIKKLLKET